MILLQLLYNVFHSAIDISYEHGSEDSAFTHSTWNTDQELLNNWDRKLDYLFTNHWNGFLNGTTHQEAHQLSDHAPVSATLNFSN